MMKKNYLPIFFVVIFCFSTQYAKVLAQHLPLNYQWNQTVSKYIITENLPIHTAFRPYIVSNDSLKYQLDSIAFDYNYFHQSALKNKNAWWWRKLLFNDFLIVKDNDFTLKLNPLVNLEMANDKNGMLHGGLPFAVNTRGLELKGTIGKNVQYHTSFFENQAFFTDYLKQYIDSTIVVPGQGAIKVFETNGFDYARAEGYLRINIQRSRFAMNIDLGNGKHFIGNGYRSLLLSDNAFSYPYLSVSLVSGKWQYSAMWAALQSFSEVYYNQHLRRHATFNYLSWKPTQRFELGLFESIIWHTSDDKTFKNKFPINFFNPLIVSRIAFYGLDNEHNMLLGVNFSYSIAHSVLLYGQTMIDNLSFDTSLDNKLGAQLGIKYFGTKNGLLKGLFAQAEINAVSSNSYAHQSVLQGFTHYNQPLTHPLGAGFVEQLAMLQYNLYHFEASAKFVNARFFDNRNVNHSQFIFSYLINPATHLKILAGYSLRTLTTPAATNSSPYLFFGICSTLNNYYYDF